MFLNFKENQKKSWNNKVQQSNNLLKYENKYCYCFVLFLKET